MTRELNKQYRKKKIKTLNDREMNNWDELTKRIRQIV
jgi:hypothetical protein